MQYDGTFKIGASYDESGSAVAIEGLRSQRFAHAGWFGAPNSPNGYTLDFDPDVGGIANKTGTGGADGFVNTFLPLITPPLDPSGIKAAVSLTLDTSDDVVDTPDYVKMMEAFLTHVPDPAVTPQDGKLALNAVMYDFDDGRFVFTDSCAEQVLPWTVIRPGNATVFARRLAHQPRRTVACKNWIAGGLRKAQMSQEGDGISACYRSILVVAAGENNRKKFDEPALLRPARDEVLDSPDPCDDCNVHQINAIAVRGDNDVQDQATFRAFTDPPNNFQLCNNNPVPPNLFYLPSGPIPYQPQDYGCLVRSDATVPGAPLQTWGLGLALHTDDSDPFFPPPLQFEHPTYTTAVQTMLRRSTRCPGDFDRDGDVEPNDLTQFMIAYNMQLPSADWNLDGGLLPTNGCVNHINMDDVYTFNAAHALGCCGP